LKVSLNSYYKSFGNIFLLNKGVHEPQKERKKFFSAKKNCLFYEPENPADLRKKIKNLLQDKNLREKLALTANN
jgi:hypothetical protein